MCGERLKEEENVRTDEMGYNHDPSDTQYSEPDSGKTEYTANNKIQLFKHKEKTSVFNEFNEFTKTKEILRIFGAIYSVLMIVLLLTDWMSLNLFGFGVKSFSLLDVASVTSYLTEIAAYFNNGEVNILIRIIPYAIWIAVLYSIICFAIACFAFLKKKSNLYEVFDRGYSTLFYLWIITLVFNFIVNFLVNDASNGSIETIVSCTTFFWMIPICPIFMFVVFISIVKSQCKDEFAPWLAELKNVVRKLLSKLCNKLRNSFIGRKISSFFANDSANK